MPLSRHFYAVDEVHAALAYRTTRCDRSETLFWCQELLLSGYASETISTLFESWLWYKGAFCLSWLVTAERLACDEVTEDDIRLGAYHLSWKECCDHSLWNILVLTVKGVEPERLTPKTPPYLPADAKEAYMIRAMFQGKAYSAWWMSRHLDDARVWSLLRWYAVHLCPVYADRYLAAFDLLESYVSLLGYSSPEYDVAVRCMAVLSLCLSAEQQADSWRSLPAEIDSSVSSMMEDWSKVVGTTAGRRDTIPIMCLYGNCARGGMKWMDSTVSQLGELEREMGDCPFWEEARSAYDLSLEDSREDFYARYVTDVPDEWSEAEKKKSHGGGVLGPTETVRLAKWARQFHIARLAWNQSGVVQAFLETLEKRDTRDALQAREAQQVTDTLKAQQVTNTRDTIDTKGIIHKTAIISWFPPISSIPDIYMVPLRRIYLP